MSARVAFFALLSWLILCGVGFKLFSPRWLLLVALFFILEKNTFFSSLEESGVTDPTEFYTFDQIYRPHPRVKAILAEPDHLRWRAFFGAKEYPHLFSHNLYLNAFQDGIRPIFPYFYIDEEFYRVHQIQEVIFSDWSHPMWSLFNVKYFVDLEGYFALWDEEDTSREGLESLVRVDEHLRLNPRAEEELFVRYRRERVETEDRFLKSLRSGQLDIENVAYLDEIDPDMLFAEEGDVPREGEKIEVIKRKPDEITAAVTLPRSGVMVFSEFWFFPWRVTVNGQSRPLRRAYHVLQAVELEKGEHLVRFYFNSRSAAFVIPTIVSGSLLILAGLYCFRQYRHIKRSERRGNVLA